MGGTRQDYISQKAAQRGAGRSTAPAPPPCSLQEVNKPRAGCGLCGAGQRERAEQSVPAGLPARQQHAAHVRGRCQALAARGASYRPGRGAPRGRAVPMERVRMINVQRLLEAAEFLERRDRGNCWVPQRKLRALLPRVGSAGRRARGSLCGEVRGSEGRRVSEAPGEKEEGCMRVGVHACLGCMCRGAYVREGVVGLGAREEGREGCL